MNPYNASHRAVHALQILDMLLYFLIEISTLILIKYVLST